MSLAATKEISLEAAVASVLLELDGSFKIKINSAEGFVCGKDLYALLPAGIRKSLVKRHGPATLIGLLSN